MNSQPQNNTAGRLDYHGGGDELRSESLRRRNRKVGLIVALVVVLLVVFTFIYVNWFGGVNKGPMAPLHSELVAPDAGAAYIVGAV
jgi:hypothetical protein